jgi:2-polyprenyl-3-methyl-5-hydroxy-6-metoxy-1,4-benzoquinol methylase
VIDYQAPADAAKTGLPPHEVDVVFSNSVLEHIPKPVLDAIFAESWRILRPGGIVFHSVNCGDHYAYTDPTVGQLNYLQFTSREWELLWNNDVQYQNRLRAVDFLELARKHEFEIVRDTSKVVPERLDELRRLPKIAPEFRRYSDEELCLTTVDFIGRKQA